MLMPSLNAIPRRTAAARKSVKTIEAYAFSGCTGLKAILIERKDTTISEGALNGASANPVIMGHGDSTAETFAGEPGYEFQNIDARMPVLSGEFSKDGSSADVTEIQHTRCGCDKNHRN